MYILFLAGGFATRLWPLTKDFPKPLLPLGTKSILEYGLEQAFSLKKRGIIKEIFISTNRAFEYMFKEWLKNKGYLKKVNLIIEPTVTEEEKFGAIKGINYDLDLIENEFGKDDIVILAGDNVFSFDLGDYIKFMLEKKAPTVAVYELADLDKAKHYGIVEVDNNNRILNFVEKPKTPRTNLAATAVYGIPKGYVDYYRRYLEEGENPDAPGFFFQWLVKQTKVYAYIFKGYWFDIGTIDGYFDALKTLLSRSYISDKAEVQGRIIDPVVIFEDSQIDSKSSVGPYVIIGKNAIIEESSLSESVVFDRTIIRRVNIKESLIGRNVILENGNITNSLIGSFSKIVFID